MALTAEWRTRIEHWRRVLAELLYRPLGEVPMGGFTTTQQLTAQQAADGSFRPMPPGTPWGARWEYGWFRGTVTLPDEARGERIVLRLEVGGHAAVYVDGRHAGARDGKHREVTLAMQGEPGRSYEVLAEAYAGHGTITVGGGPVPHGVETVPEATPTQQRAGTTTFGIWEEEAYQLWLDVETLTALRDSLDPDSLRVAEIDAALRDFTVIVDLELPRRQMLETVRGGRERLRPLLECVNGTTTPLMFCFGHAHLDVAWLWPLAETERRAVRTLSTVLALAEEYPEYRYLQSQPELFRMIRAGYPDLYERVKKAVKAGTIVADGATWVQMDTNVTGGEALVRQFLHGKRFYRDEFGVDCELLWLPDVFGYSGALPQIMRGCGVKYFSTAKIFWNYHGGDPFPHNTFTWEGTDGSRVLVHLCNDYNSRTSPDAVIGRWRERVQKDGLSTRLMPFGWGDGGGGPTRNHLEFLRRERDLEGVPKTRMAAPVEYFKDLQKRGVPEVNYVGELYYQCHRGTYTSQARTKRGNRKSEFALREAEIWGAAAAALRGRSFPAEQMAEAWRGVLVNQFHDVLPGSSIARVYEEAEATYAAAIRTADEVADGAMAALAGEGEGALTVFNSLSWERAELVPLPEGFEGAASAAGDPLPVQELDGRLHAEVSVPSCGWTTLRFGKAFATPDTLAAAEDVLENGLIRVELNERGEITSILDKESGRELAAGPCNCLRMYKDVPAAFDAWDIDSMYERTPVALPEEAEVEVLAAGPLVAALRVRRKLNRSEMVQRISLRRGSRRVEFDTTIDWQENHKLLKVNFPVDFHAGEAVHEIQFGHLHRPNHKSRPFDADRYEVCNQKWTALAEEGRGFAVLNDCKYGVNVDGNSINLTLLRAPSAPDMNADKGEQRFTYAFYAWNGSLAESGVVREAYELNVPAQTAPGDGGRQSLLRLDAPNVIVETVKPAEDGSGDVVLRLYEAMRTATECTLETALPVKAAEVTDMLEENGEAVEVAEGGRLRLAFRPFEIKTLRLKL
jgi:alpha-mannosidase